MWVNDDKGFLLHWGNSSKTGHLLVPWHKKEDVFFIWIIFYWFAGFKNEPNYSFPTTLKEKLKGEKEISDAVVEQVKSEVEDQINKSKDKNLNNDALHLIDVLVKEIKEKRRRKDSEWTYSVNEPIQWMLHATALSVLVTPSRSLDAKLQVSLKFGKHLIQYFDFQPCSWPPACVDHSYYYKELSLKMCLLSIFVALIQDTSNVFQLR